MIPQAQFSYGAAAGPEGIHALWDADPALISILLVILVFGMTEARHRPAFFLAWLLIAFAFVSPFNALSAALFSALTLHHLLMVMLIAPLLAISIPLRLMRASLALVSTVLVLAMWYLPSVYTALWADARIFWLMQGLLLGSATIFWSEVLAMARGEIIRDERGRLLPGQYEGASLIAAAIMMAVLAGAMALIGSMLTFARRAFYPENFAGAAIWQVDPLLDQHLAGLMLWIPGIVPLVLLTLIFLQRSGQSEEEGDGAAERERRPENAR